MSFSEKLKFFYGVCMGTSVPMRKTTKRHVWKSLFHKIDDGLTVQIGGTHNCGILINQDQILLIDTNSRRGSERLAEWLNANCPDAKVKMILQTYRGRDANEGASFYPDAEIVGPPIVESRTLQFGGETIQIQPIPQLAGESDLVVYLQNRKILFMGELFYNRIHPNLLKDDRVHADKWIPVLEQLDRQFDYVTAVPAEGDLGGRNEVALFQNYLRDLSNPAVGFGECRKKYDWMEIPALTSLEENFDVLRH